MDRADVVAPCGPDEGRLRGRVRVDAGLVAIEDLLRGELCEPVFEKHRQEWMIEREPDVDSLHAVFETTIAHAVEQLGSCEVAVRGGRRAEVENLPRPRADGKRLHLHEADHTLFRVLGDEHLLGEVGDRHHR